MRSCIILSLLILLIATKSTAQIPLLINNQPNKEIKPYFEKKFLNIIRTNYEEFINFLKEDSTYNLTFENSNFDNFEI